MTYILYSISAMLFLVAFIGCLAVFLDVNVDEISIGLIFIASGVFSIAGVLA